METRNIPRRGDGTPPGLRITRTEDPGGAGIVRLDGEVDHAQCERLEAALTAPVSGFPHLVVVDLSGVTFCDSAGLNTLLKIRRALEASAHGHLVLAALSMPMRRLLAITGADEVFAISPDVQAALGGGDPPE